MRIAFAGNPNSGKTTMYNALTGENERIGNWAGVTIGKKESPIKKEFYDFTEDLIAVDLPGAYSMSPFTPEESITSGYVRDEKMCIRDRRRAALLLYQILSETQVILWYNGCIGWRRTKEYTRVIDKRTVIYGSHKFYIRIGYRRSSGGADDIFTCLLYTSRCV